MDKPKLTQPQFLKDVATHEMQVLKDDGLYRHIRFKKPGSYDRYFDLVTWPGYLAYSGDMGCYVFSRLQDMLDFFRVDRKYGVAINPCYWGEKCESADRQALTEFDEDKARKRIKEALAEWMRDNREFTTAQRREVREQVQDEVLHYVDEGEHALRDAMNGFENEHAGRLFEDAWEWDLRGYSFHYLWCCYALAWGIQKYDDAKAAQQPAAEAAHG